MKNSIENIGSRAQHMGERINDLEDSNTETIQLGEERELIFLKSEKTPQELSDSFRKANVRTN